MLNTHGNGVGGGGVGAAAAVATAVKHSYWLGWLIGRVVGRSLLLGPRPRRRNLGDRVRYPARNRFALLSDPNIHNESTIFGRHAYHYVF